MRVSNIIIVIILISIAAVIGYLAGGRATVPPTMLSGAPMPSVPPVKGFYKGQEILFIHTEASDKKVSEMLTMMMNSPVIFVPSLAKTPAASLDDIFVFTNGTKGEGPMGFQPDVFSSVPTDPDYTPLKALYLVTWTQESIAREIRSVEEIKKLEDKGKIKIVSTGIVVNMPIISWLGGKR